MKIFKIFPLLIFVALAFGQQETKEDFKFDIADFSKKSAVAEWLVKYDLVAWKTSDEVMKQDKSELAKLGAEWFCFQDKNDLWHAVYGKYENDKYNQVFHFTMDADSKISRVNENIDQTFLNLHAKALATANAQLAISLKNKSAPRFNQYIKQNADKTFSVWLFPAFQTNGMAVYGGEGIYTIDSTAAKIIKDESYFQDNFRGFQTGNPREIWLNYRELEKPTLGSVFFVWYYKNYFTKIFIDNAQSTSTVIANNWIHIEKEKN